MISQEELKNTHTVSIYLDDGRVFSYSVRDEFKAMEHASAIMGRGYFHTNLEENYTECYPPARILKVKISGKVTTSFPDTTSKV